MNDDTYIIPYEFTGMFRCRAASPEQAREMFEAMSDQELAEEAERWVDDRTFTEAEYADAIKETKEGPAPTERAGSGPALAGASAGADAGSA